MLKFLLVTASSLAFLTVLVPTATFSRPLPPVNQATQSTPENTQKISVDEPICYMQTADGRIIELNKLCSKSSVGSATRNTYSQPPNVYNFTEIEKFDAEVYGEGG